MDIERQRCASCGAEELHNVIQHQERHPPTVFVCCARCHALVARYQPGDVYLHGQGMAAWLNGQDPGLQESGRATLLAYAQVKREALAGYAVVRRALERKQ